MQVRKSETPATSDDLDQFGAAVFRHRTRLRLTQAAVAAAAAVAPGYFSQLENGKRTAPPRETAMRIAKALRLPGEEVQRLAALAEAERAMSTTDAHLDCRVQHLLADIRRAAPMLDATKVELLQAKLREVCM